jgi:hypothetical protein
MAKDLFELDHYLIRRKLLKFLGASFHVLDGERVVGFTSQKAFKLREDIRIFSDDSKSVELLTIRARQVIDFAAAYDVVDTREGVKIGAARRKGFRSIMRDSWELLDAEDRPVAQLQEDSMTMAMLRRFLTNLIPQTFHVDVGRGSPAVLQQRFNPFIYKLEVRIPPDCPLDRRLILATAALIAAIEGRQG